MLGETHVEVLVDKYFRGFALKLVMTKCAPSHTRYIHMGQVFNPGLLRGVSLPRGHKEHSACSSPCCQFPVLGSIAEAKFKPKLCQDSESIALKRRTNSQSATVMVQDVDIKL